ncbi:hypothetical protein RSAG8_08108, partial [Rhizoctonia solani AG-8 WAC10335]
MRYLTYAHKCDVFTLPNESYALPATTEVPVSRHLLDTRLIYLPCFISGWHHPRMRLQNLPLPQ